MDIPGCKFFLFIKIMNLDTFKLVECFFSKQISDSDLNQLIMNKLMNKFCNNIRQILLSCKFSTNRYHNFKKKKLNKKIILL